MPSYTMLSDSTVAVMKKSLEPYQKELEALKKSKGDKKKIAELEKTIAQKSEAYIKKLDGDMATAKNGCNQMLLAVEGYLTQAAKSLKMAKDYQAKLAKGPGTLEKSLIDEAPGFIADLGKLADAEMTSYAQSWNTYRQYSAGTDAAKNFMAVRAKIMDDTKLARTKVDKIVAMAQEAAAIKKAAADLTANTIASLEEKRAEAKDLVTQLQELAKGIYTGKGSVDTVPAAAKQMKDNIAGASDVKNLQARMVGIDAQYAFTKKAIQSFVTTAGTMKRTAATAKSAIHKMYLGDKDIQASLAEADRLVTKAETDVKNAAPYVAEMATLVNAANAKIKKGK